MENGVEQFWIPKHQPHKVNETLPFVSFFPSLKYKTYNKTFSLYSIGTMAHTKQTPRNPNVERPTAAMGSDIQPERRTPSKPASKKLPAKGGKQPQKHLLHNLIR